MSSSINNLLKNTFSYIKRTDLGFYIKCKNYSISDLQAIRSFLHSIDNKNIERISLQVINRYSEEKQTPKLSLQFNNIKDVQNFINNCDN